MLQNRTFLRTDSKFNKTTSFNTASIINRQRNYNYKLINKSSINNQDLFYTNFYSMNEGDIIQKKCLNKISQLYQSNKLNNIENIFDLKDVRNDGYFSNRLVNIINFYNNFKNLDNISHIYEFKDIDSEVRLFVYFDETNLNASIVLIDLFHLVFPTQEKNQRTDKLQKMKKLYDKRKNRKGDIINYFDKNILISQ